MMKIGTMSNGSTVRIAPTSMNQHVVILGMCGAGKSTMLKSATEDLIKAGESVIEFRLETQETMEVDEKVNTIDAMMDGIAIELLGQESVNSGQETFSNFIASVTDLFASTQTFGARQIGVLREAIEFAIEHRDEYSSEMAAIDEALKMQESAIAQGVRNKLWPLLNSGVIRKGGKKVSVR